MNASYRQGQCLATTLVAAALLACGPTVADEPTARRNAVRLLGAESYEVACVTEIRGGHLVALKIRTAPDMVSHDLEWRPVVVVDSLGTVRRDRKSVV